VYLRQGQRQELVLLLGRVLTMTSVVTRVAEAIAGPRLCKVMGHRWQVIPSILLRGRPSAPFKICLCCNFTEELPKAPPADHPDSMTSGVTPEQAAWLRTVDPEYAQGAS
jgi:hypothetical protein